MNGLSQHIQLEVFDSIEDLAPDLQQIVEEAIRQLDLSYAPYSKFNVGAAVLMADGKTYGGSNQENAAYPLCMCGERVALYHAHAMQKDTPVVAVAITARNANFKIVKPVMPCGACRQVITEYATRHKTVIKVLLRTDDGKIYVCNDAHQLLPFGFDQTFL